MYLSDLELRGNVDVLYILKRAVYAAGIAIPLFTGSRLSEEVAVHTLYEIEETENCPCPEET